jgi:Domain of unknown function (DUF4178)
VGKLLFVLAAVLFIASIVVLVIALRRPRQKAQPGQPSGRPDPLSFNSMPQFGYGQLGPGAVISHGGIDYLVRGSVTYREGPYTWWEHLLEGGDQPIWFSVEEDDGRLELVMWVTRKDLTLRPGDQYVADGVTFRESERGRASYTSEGMTGLPAYGEMEYLDCTSADKTALLSFERWAPDMPWEVSTGKSVLPGELLVYPAPPAA